MYRYGKTVYWILVIGLMVSFLFAGCSPKIQLTLLPYELTVNAEEQTAAIQVIIRNDGDTLTDVSMEEEAFGNATLTSENGKEYVYKVSNVMHGAMTSMNHGDRYSKIYDFRNIEESGYYTLTFRFLGRSYTISDLYIDIQE